MISRERRGAQRLRLARPILSFIDGQNALILDIGLGGAFIEHYGGLSRGSRFRLQFRWQGEPVEFECEVVRSEVVREGGDGVNVVSHSGVRFVRAIGGAYARLTDMMATYVGRVLAAQRANASGEDAANSAALSQLGGAHRLRTHGYLTFRFLNGVWRREQTSSSVQPEEGFTVAAHEDQEELETLLRTYEHADAEGRRLIRLLAELSARNALT